MSQLRVNQLEIEAKIINAIKNKKAILKYLKTPINANQTFIT